MNSLSRFKQSTLSAFIWFFITIAVDASFLLKSDNGSYSRQKRGLSYISFSAGAGAWYMSNQTGLDNRFMPYSVFLEYGRTSSPFSLTTGVCFRTTFNIDKFLINPNNLMLGVQVAPLRQKPVSKRFNIYGACGINIGYSIFTEELYPGILNYENKVEKKKSLGLGAGAGMGYKIKFIEVKPMLYYFTGHSGFLAGHFTEQRYNTGSLQLHIAINYKLVSDKNRKTCPVYRKYHRP